MDTKCPKCGGDNAHQRVGTLYFECWTCDYAWIPDNGMGIGEGTAPGLGSLG